MTTRLMQLVQARRPEQGATAVEYALMITLIAIVIIVAVIVLGESVSSIFDDAGTKI